MVNKNICIFLCDLTGIMAEPWADAGYECWLFDAQHPEGHTFDGKYHKVGGWLTTTEDVWKWVDKTQVAFGFSFPECTNLAVSGAAHFDIKLGTDPDVWKRSMSLVYLCDQVGKEAGCPFGLENPISIISSIWRKPDFIFDPWEYGGYLPVDDVHPLYPEYIPARDAYPKTTCIWARGGFCPPMKIPVKKPKGLSPQVSQLGGKSLKTKNIRSATPRGFAKAVFLQHGVRFEGGENG